MLLMKPSLFTLLCLFVFAPLVAQADSLTGQKVQSFINSMEALQGMEDEFSDLNEEMAASNNTGEMPDLSTIFSSSVEKMKGHEAHDRVQDVVQQHGFANTDQWGKTGDRIFSAWTALEMGKHSGHMNNEMAQAMEQINNNPNMSEAQKKQMRDMMGGAMSAMEQANNVPEADKQAVRPYMDALRSMTGSSR